jgi:glycolate oxidase FAD binding subunit
MSPLASTQKIVSPQSSDQAAEFLRHANEQKLAIKIVGSGTKHGWGRPIDAALLLDTTQLTGIREHSWQDLTATVAAGTPWSTMQQALAVHGQHVALDPLWPDKATVGGIIATNDSGSLRLRYGSLRDLIIGMTIVLADGTIARSGGKVVKNVAGYDMHKLMTGAFGTLGLITEVTFRLHPIPKSSATWTVTSNDIAALDRVRHQLADSTMAIEAMQIRADGEKLSLDVKFATLPDALEDHSQRLRAIAAPLEVASGDDANWLYREKTFHPERATVKIATSPAQIAAFISEVQNMDGHCVTQQSSIMTASLKPDPGQISDLRKKVEGAGGSLAVLQWPRNTVPRPDDTEISAGSIALMREIKRQFDPNQILNHGRFPGGI